MISPTIKTVRNEDCERRRQWTGLSPSYRPPHPQDRIDRWKAAATFLSLTLLAGAIIAGIAGRAGL
jgi:hypothetical protein